MQNYVEASKCKTFCSEQMLSGNLVQNYLESVPANGLCSWHTCTFFQKIRKLEKVQ